MKEESSHLTNKVGRRSCFPVIRMKHLNIDDYYSQADKERDIAAIGAFFDKKKAQTKCLDGVKMIKLFVENNRMSQWQVSKKTRKLRENFVK
jgi:hypothetical protein